jgi:hypothetical protein
MNKKEYMTIKINVNRVMYVVQERNYNDNAESTLLSTHNICICVFEEDATTACVNYTRNKNMYRYDCAVPFWYKKYENGKTAKIVDYKPLHIDF